MFKKSLEGKITKLKDELGNHTTRPHVITKDELTNTVEVTPITTSTQSNTLEVKTKPDLKHTSYLVPNKKREVDRKEAKDNLTGQVVVNRKEVFKHLNDT